MSSRLSLGQRLGEAQTVALPPLGEEYWTGDYTTRVPSMMTPDLAELVGYFMGDGSMHSKGPRFCIANTDLDVGERVRVLAKSLFNLEAHLTPQQGYCEVALHSVPLALWWDACGFSKLSPGPDHSGKGYLPRIPDAVLASNDPAVYGAFLRGLYEADGTVTGGHPLLEHRSPPILGGGQGLCCWLSASRLRPSRTRPAGAIPRCMCCAFAIRPMRPGSSRPSAL